MQTYLPTRYIFVSNLIISYIINSITFVKINFDTQYNFTKEDLHSFIYIV